MPPKAPADTPSVASLQRTRAGPSPSRTPFRGACSGPARSTRLDLRWGCSLLCWSRNFGHFFPKIVAHGVTSDIDRHSPRASSCSAKELRHLAGLGWTQKGPPRSRKCASLAPGERGGGFVAPARLVACRSACVGRFAFTVGPPGGTLECVELALSGCCSSPLVRSPQPAWVRWGEAEEKAREAL
jgi:hypothetical protein